MRSSSASKLRKLTVLLAVLAALSYAVTIITASPAMTQGMESPSLMPVSSHFAASGGLVADAGLAVPTASDARRHCGTSVVALDDASAL